MSNKPTGFKGLTAKYKESFHEVNKQKKCLIICFEKQEKKNPKT